MRARQHQVDRGQAATGVLGALSAAVDRRGEAHLWLLLEEALWRVAAGQDPALDGRRELRHVADALVGVGALDGEVAEAVVREFDDVLAVRRLLPASAFHGEPFPAIDTRAPYRPTGGDVWLESEIERHLDLLADLHPKERPDAGARALEILAVPARALAAVGALEPDDRPIADLAASLAQAGYAVPDLGGRARPAWVRFLRQRPAALTDGDRPDRRRRADALLGEVDGEELRVLEVAWSERVLEVTTSRVTGDDQPRVGSVVDDAGDLHLGQYASIDEHAVLRLRPGLGATVRALTVRLTHGNRRFEAGVALWTR